MPHISVIVPIYNGEKYLKECLDSIANQTERDFETILVDDGSTDNSPSIADEFVAQDSRFKIIHKRNEGVSAARNSALAVALGDYVTMIDCDDTVNEQYLEVLYKACIEHNVDVAICNHVVKTVNGAISDSLSESFPDGCVVSGTTVLDTFYNPERVGFYAVGKMYRREKVGNLLFTRDIRMCEDDLFNVQFYSKPDITATFCSNAEYRYRIHGASATKSASCEKMLEKVKAYSIILENANSYPDSLFQKGIERDYTLSLVSLCLTALKDNKCNEFDIKERAKEALEKNSEFGGVLSAKYKMFCKLIILSPYFARLVFLSIQQAKRIVAND